MAIHTKRREVVATGRELIQLESVSTTINCCIVVVVIDVRKTVGRSRASLVEQTEPCSRKASGICGGHDSGLTGGMIRPDPLPMTRLHFAAGAVDFFEHHY